MKIKVADYIAKRLAAYGVTEVFHVYGSVTAELTESLANTPGIRYLCCPHEAVAGYAAEGYSKISGKIGVTLATSGPGALNMVTAAANCYYDSVACLFISGNVNTRFMKPEDEEIRQIGFQEAAVIDIVKPITKYAKCIKKAEDVRYCLEKAVHLATHGRKGGVWLDVPIDIQKTLVEENDLVGYDPTLDNIECFPDNDEKIHWLCQDLLRNERPYMLVGGGIRSSDAVWDLIQLVNLLEIPVSPTYNATDVITADNPFFGGLVGTYGGCGRNFGLQGSNFFLGIGTRLSGRISGGNPPSLLRGAKKYLVDADGPSLQPKLQQVPCDVNIYSDARTFINRFKHILLDDYATSLKEAKVRWQPWLERCLGWVEKYDSVPAEVFNPTEKVNPYAFVRILSEEASENDIINPDCGGNLVVSMQSFKTKQGQRFFTNNGNSPMGFSVCSGIGAYYGLKAIQENEDEYFHKDGQVIVIIGDGGLLLSINAFETIRFNKIPIKVICLNNRCFGITREFQEVNYNGRYEACGPEFGYSCPDLAKVAESFGVKSVTIDSGMDYMVVRQQIREFLDYEGPLFINVDLGVWTKYRPKTVGFDAVIEDQFPHLPAEELIENIITPLPDSYSRVIPGLSK